LDAFLHLSALPKKPDPKLDDFVTEPTRDVTVDLSNVSEKETEVTLSKNVTDENLANTGLSFDENHKLIGGIPFVRIPAGKFIMGSKKDNELANEFELPQHIIALPTYWIAKYPITNAQYSDFVEGGNHPVHNWKEKKDYPIVNVSWFDAIKFCEWFNKTYKKELEEQNLKVNLPTEAQWEKAARGEYGNEWPWGNEFGLGKCNSEEENKRAPTPIDEFPDGESVFGVADLAGNVWEWTHTLFTKYPYQFDYEDQGSDGRRTLRGGSYFSPRWDVRCATRNGNSPENKFNYIGFRVCAVPMFE
jgi:formylglycine-generating enzyme required for sulfatase activity